MQNKANFRKSQINVSDFMTTGYSKMDTWLSGKNKPKTNPNEPKTNPKQSQNKAKTNPNKANFRGKKSSKGANDRIEQSAITNSSLSNICRLTIEIIGSTLLIVSVFEGFIFERTYYEF